ncbi:unnamed protein product, partial [Owenia fusiformis]
LALNSDDMGVKDLWSILAPVKEHKPLDSLASQTIAVDLSMWICETQSMKELQGKVAKPHLRNLFFRVSHLLRIGVKLVFVTEGDPPELKWEAIQKRTQLRLGHRGQHKGTTSKPPKKQTRSHFKAVVRECCEMLDYLGVSHIQSAGEAEAMCAHLNHQGLVDAVITEDGDAFLYGAKKVYRNFTMNNKDPHVECYSLVDIENTLDLSREKLVALGIFLGCDYLPKGVPGVGKEQAMKLLQSFKDGSVFDRLRSWKDDRRLDDLEKMFQMKKVSHCTTCGHPGSSKEHKKSGCKRCESDTYCMPSDYDFTCSCQWHVAIGTKETWGLEISVRKKALLSADFPHEKVIAEFLQAIQKVKRGRKFDWNRPDWLKLQPFNLKTLEWPEEYTLEKVLPLTTLWDMRNIISGGARDHHLKPICIIKSRVRQGVPSYEVHWHKLDTDPLTVEDHYTTIESAELFARSFPQLVDRYETEQLTKKPAKKRPVKPKKTVETINADIGGNPAEIDSITELMSDLRVQNSDYENRSKIQKQFNDASQIDVHEPVETMIKNISECRVPHLRVSNSDVQILPGMNQGQKPKIQPKSEETFTSNKSLELSMDKKARVKPHHEKKLNTPVDQIDISIAIELPTVKTRRKPSKVKKDGITLKVKDESKKAALLALLNSDTSEDDDDDVFPVVKETDDINDIADLLNEEVTMKPYMHGSDPFDNNNDLLPLSQRLKHKKHDKVKCSANECNSYKLVNSKIGSKKTSKQNPNDKDCGVMTHIESLVGNMSINSHEIDSRSHPKPGQRDSVPFIFLDTPDQSSINLHTFPSETANGQTLINDSLDVSTPVTTSHKEGFTKDCRMRNLRIACLLEKSNQNFEKLNDLSPPRNDLLEVTNQWTPSQFGDFKIESSMMSNLSMVSDYMGSKTPGSYTPGQYKLGHNTPSLNTSMHTLTSHLNQDLSIHMHTYDGKDTGDSIQSQPSQETSKEPPSPKQSPTHMKYHAKATSEVECIDTDGGFILDSPNITESEQHRFDSPVQGPTNTMVSHIKLLDTQYIRSGQKMNIIKNAIEEVYSETEHDQIDNKENIEPESSLTIMDNINKKTTKKVISTETPVRLTLTTIGLTFCSLFHHQILSRLTGTNKTSKMSVRDYVGCYEGLDDLMLDGNKYVCKLEPKWAKKAKDELNEDPKERDAAVDQLRQWIKQQPHYSVCTDSIFLLQFLRRCRYSQLEARTMFDIFHSKICSQLPSWMCNIDTKSSAMKTLFLKEMPMIILPERDSEGRRIILWRAGGYQTGKDCGYNVGDLFTYIGIIYMTIMREEMTQVNGFTILQDGTGHALKHTTFVGAENIKNAAIIFYNNFPARVKNVYMYNMGAFMEALVAIFWPFLSTTLKERFSYFSNLEELYKKIPMELLPKEYLPDDYTGPHAGTISQISSYWYDRLTSSELHKRIKTLSTTQFKVDEKKRPKKGQDDEIASFRKLNIS